MFSPSSFFAIIVLGVAAVVPLLITNAQQFSYDPNDPFGPQNWGQVDVPNNQCDGNRNSPIAFERQPRCDLRGNYVFDNGNCRINNNFYAITNRDGRYDYPSNCRPPSMEMPWKEGIFDAIGFNFHLQSEHTLNGRTFDAEFQIAHGERDNPGSFAILAIMMTATDNDNTIDPAKNRAFEKILSGWELAAAQDGVSCSTSEVPQTCRATEDITNYQRQTFNLYDLIPNKANGNPTDYMAYEGSFTVPPCTEIVSWNVAISRLLITSDQLSRLTSLITGYRDATSCELATIANPRPTWSTNRPVQPINDRTPIKICRRFNPDELDLGEE